MNKTSSEWGSSEAVPLSSELRPVRAAFLVQRVAPGAAIILFITVIAAIVSLFAEVAVSWTGAIALGGVLLAGLWVLGAGWWASVAYSKERYEFFEHRIVAHRGSPISDQTSELTIRNITHVKRRLPWPHYPLFGVGDVMIESAGSQASEIRLRTIRRPDQAYEGVAALMRANVHKHHLECHEGIWWRRRYFARHDNVKRLELTRYPGGDVGTVRFVVAGERRPGGSSGAPGMNRKSNLEGMGATSYGFGVRYAEEISRHCWSIDQRLQGFDPQPDCGEATPEHDSRPAVANSLTPLIAVSVVILPLVVLLPVTVPLTVTAIRRRRYLVEPQRVILRSGILYRRQASILHDRIDSIRRDQNLLGKLFGNGNVTIFTAGSSRPDMELTNAPDYEQLFVVLKSLYQD